MGNLPAEPAGDPHGVRRPELRVLPAPYTGPDATRLVEEVQAEYVTLYGSPDEGPLDADVFDPPRGAFFVGYLDGVPVAMGGWRLRSDVLPLGGTRAAEIKRMYVAPAARRLGHARALLGHLEDTARVAGADVMVLETGTAQAAAIRMYVASGYERVQSFGYYSWSPLQRCFGKRL